MPVYYYIWLFGPRSSESFGSENSITILFVGNSHTFYNDVPRQLQRLAIPYGIEISYKDISTGGANLSQSKDKAVNEMQGRHYDYVVIQDQGRRPQNNIDGFLSDIQFLCGAARENGATPVLYNPAWVNNNGQPDEDRQSIFTSAYLQAANENDVVLVNAGDAWVYAYQSLSELSLYAFDRQHANKAGVFLTACVFAATLFDLRIEDIPTDSLYKGSNASDIAQVAWEFVHQSP